MTISSIVNRNSTAGDGIVTAFSFPYLFFANDDLKVILIVDSTGVETTQTITTEYTVAGAGVAAGGTVTMVTAPASGETLVIIREEQFTQGLDLVENDPFPSDLVEQSLDSLTMLTQQLNTEVGRSAKLSDGDTSGADVTIPNTTGNGGKFLSLASGALSFVWAELTSTVAVLSDTAAEDTGTGAAGTSAEISRADHVHAIPTNGVVSAMITALNVTTGKLAALAVTTEKIAGDAVTLAKMAVGTDGNLISYDTNGDPVAVATGTAAQVLTSNGAGAAPTFQTISAGPTLGTPVDLSSGTDTTFSGIPAGTVAVDIPIINIQFSTDVRLDIQLGDSGGIETSGYVGGGTLVDVGPNSETSTAEFIVMTNDSQSAHGTLHFRLVNSSNNTWEFSMSGFGAATSGLVSAGTKSLSGVLTQIKLSGGTFDGTSGEANIITY